MSDGLDETLRYTPVVDNGPSQPPPTAEMPVATSGWEPSRLALLFVAVGAAAFLIGIAVATATRPALQETTIARGSIGPSGGTVRFPGGEIHVPRGALTHEVEIAVRRSTYDDQVQVRSERSLVFPPGKLYAYRFLPTDLSFSRAAEITFRLPAGARNGTAFARRGEEVVLLPGTVDPNRETTTTVVDDFRFDGGRS